MSEARYIVADVYDGLRQLADNSVDLVMTSPPFLAVRSYLPADHPDKAKEIGGEATPAAFLDVMLAVVAECDRVLAPHGSLVFELGDTYSGSGGAGGDYAAEGLRDGQPAFSGSARKMRPVKASPDAESHRDMGEGYVAISGGDGWPLAKSKALIPELFAVALAYGINPLTGQPSPAGRWRVRNVIAWCRTNPPVGALGDKFRPGHSSMIVACRNVDRWFDDIPTRKPASENTAGRTVAHGGAKGDPNGRRDSLGPYEGNQNPAGAPLLDWWVINNTGFAGATTTSRRVPCGPHDGGERTTSPDCPVHGDQPAPSPTERRGGCGSHRCDHTSRTDSCRACSPRRAGESTDGSHAREGSSPIQTSESSAPTRSDAATPHDTGSSRTAHDPATTQPGTPSVGTSPRTTDTSASPSCAAPHPDMLGSSSSACGSDGSPPSGNPDGSGCTETSSAASPCTCSFTRVITESTSHYATYPEALVTPVVQSMCPEWVCRTCGAPRRRIVETTQLSTGRQTNGAKNVGRKHESATAYATRTESSTTTLGWTDCGHDNYRRGVTLDPFCGTGTTLAAATGNGRDAIGIDLDPRNLDHTRSRLGMFLVEGASA